MLGEDKTKQKLLQDGTTLRQIIIQSEHRQNRTADPTVDANEQKYRNVVENIPIGVALISPDMQVLSLNKQAREWFPHVDATLRPRCYKMFYNQPESNPCPSCPSRKTFQDGSTNHAIVEIPVRDTVATYRLTSSPIKDDTGAVIATVELFEDLSKERLLEEQLRLLKEKLEQHIQERTQEIVHLESQLQQAQKMEAIGTLAGGIAHDFNNLLTAIQGQVSIMSLSPTIQQDHRESLGAIENLVARGADLTKQLLGFARAKGYKVVPTDLNQLVRESADLFGRTRKEIRIFYSFQKDLWTVAVDPGQLEQVLLNLFVNAWQAMPAGGEIYLKTENSMLDERYKNGFTVRPGRYVKMTVTDTGNGMDDGVLKRIFEPFFTTKKKGIGTGLGLATAYGIIKNHGGIIDVESAVGEGSSFFVFLPATDTRVERKRQITPDIILRGKETILLVDDEEMIIEIGERILASFGYRVLSARSGQEALDIYSSNKESIGLVILDLVMPNMGGGKVFDELKAIDPDAKVLLSSGYSLDGQAGEILDRGCNGFVQKPFKVTKLSQQIREILGKKN